MTDATNDRTSPDRAARLMRRATYASVACAAFLVVIKAVAWVMTGSVAMLSALTDSALDLAASVLNLLAVRHALEPPDAEHRFGHGKAEAIAGLGQSALIGGSAVFLVLESVRRLLSPEPIEAGVVGVGVGAVSIVATLALVAYQRRVVAQTGSVAISADRLHYVSDLALNGGVMVSIAVSAFADMPLVDPIVALVIALWIGRSAFQIASSSWDHLMDREMPDDDRAAIAEIAMSHPEARSLHDLRTRLSGVTPFIQFHLELDPRVSLLTAHRIADQVEAMILDRYPGAEIIIHQDPHGLEEPPELAVEPT